MPKNVTIKDIAAQAGVSIALVSFVMNNRIEADGKQKYRVSETTRKRILEIAKKLNYQPNFAARTLRRGRSMVIGALLSDISNVFYGEIAKELEDIAFHHGYTVLFGSTDESPEKMERLVRSFIDKGVEGFIIVPCEGSERILRHIYNIGIPLVIMDRKDYDIPAPKVVLNGVEAMKNAVNLLVKKGITNIEMMSYTMRVSSISDREVGFLESMKALGAGDEDIRIHRLPFNRIQEATNEIIPSILERNVKGLVFATNSLSVAAIRKLFSMGISIQQDVHIVGFDNSEVYNLFTPAIPHVCQPIDRICKETLSLLFGILEKKFSQESSVVVLDGILVND